MVYLIYSSARRKVSRTLSIAIGALMLLAAGCGGVANSTETARPAATVSAAAPSNTTQPTSAPAATDSPTSTSAPSPITAMAGTTPTAAVSDATDWPSYHRDITRTGYIAGMPDPQQLTVAWNTALDGTVYAEPLVVGGHVLAATESNSVYSLNPDTGKIEWQTNLGAPVTRSALPCGNIDPLGITGTPVYDPASGLVFVVAEVGGSGPAHILAGIDARTGEVKVRRSADPQGMEPAPHQQRAALTLWQGMVYIAYGGLFGDCGNYHGWVVASRTDGSGPLLAYQVPTGREGGIWAPPGPLVDAGGRLFVSVGNGDQTSGDWDHSDSVLRLSSSLQLEDGFAPDQWQQDNARDADLGSLSPVLLPGGLIFIAGKAGIGYLLHADALGGVGGQIAAQQVCHAYGGAAVAGSTAFIPCNEGLQQIHIGSDKSLTLGWQAPQVPGSPVVGGHTIYSLGGGTLYALDITSGQPRANVEVGATSRFATPTLYQNRVLIGTMSGITAVTIVTP